MTEIFSVLQQYTFQNPLNMFQYTHLFQSTKCISIHQVYPNTHINTHPFQSTKSISIHEVYHNTQILSIH